MWTVYRSVMSVMWSEKQQVLLKPKQ